MHLILYRRLQQTKALTTIAILNEQYRFFAVRGVLPLLYISFISALEQKKQRLACEADVEGLRRKEFKPDEIQFSRLQ